jgi:hypothetical protein
VVLDGGPPPRRSRRGQGDGERVAAQNHERDQPPDSLLAVGVGAEQFHHVADGRGLGLYLPPFGGHAGTFRLPALGIHILLVSREGGVGIGHVVARGPSANSRLCWLTGRRNGGRRHARRSVCWISSAGSVVNRLCGVQDIANRVYAFAIS